MRFMIQVRATLASEAGERPDDELMAAMDTYHQELAKAGVLLDAAGLRPTSDGWRVEFAAGRHRVVDGPFAETRELIAGYTLIEVGSRAEALEWSRRFPAPFGALADATIEVRRLYEAEDFEPGGVLGPAA